MDNQVRMKFINKTSVIMKTPERLKRLTSNSIYLKGGVSCSKDSFVVNQTFVFQIKFCGKSPAFREAVKRQVVKKLLTRLNLFGYLP